MRILINASNLHIGGGIQVADSIIREIVNFPQYEYRVVVSAAVRKELGGWSGHRQIRIVEYTAKPKLSSVLSGRDAFLDRQVKEFSPDAVFRFSADLLAPDCAAPVRICHPSLFIHQTRHSVFFPFDI